MKKTFLELGIISVILILFLTIITILSGGSEIGYLGVFLLIGIFVFGISLAILFLKKIYIDWYLSLESNVYFTSILISFISIITFLTITQIKYISSAWGYLGDRGMIYLGLILGFLMIVVYGGYLEKKYNSKLNNKNIILMFLLSILFGGISYFINNILIGFIILNILYVASLGILKYINK